MNFPDARAAHLRPWHRLLTLAGALVQRLSRPRRWSPHAADPCGLTTGLVVAGRFPVLLFTDLRQIVAKQDVPST